MVKKATKRIEGIPPTLRNGPWELEFDSMADYNEIRSATGTVAFLMPHVGEHEENYRKMAAAPDLLEALETYVKHYGDPLQCARAAIAKARGMEAE